MSANKTPLLGALPTESVNHNAHTGSEEVQFVRHRHPTNPCKARTYHRAFLNRGRQTPGSPSATASSMDRGARPNLPVAPLKPTKSRSIPSEHGIREFAKQLRGNESREALQDERPGPVRGALLNLKTCSASRTYCSQRKHRLVPCTVRPSRPLIQGTTYGPTRRLPECRPRTGMCCNLSPRHKNLAIHSITKKYRANLYGSRAWSLDIPKCSKEGKERL